MPKYEKGKVVQATVTGIEKYGIFVSLDDSYSGLIHISELSHNFVKDVNSFAKVGDIINAEIVEIDTNTSHVKLSIKNLNYKSKEIIKKKKIDETIHGFTTLSAKLPFWIEEGKKKYKKK